MKRLDDERLERKPHLGDIGDDEPGECDDPTHDDECECGARPDAWEEY